jgi:hypothetical protein
MNPPIQGRRQSLPTILTVYRPVEEYWEACRPTALPDTGPVEALDPLDAFLVHRLLDLVPGDPVLIDAAIGRTGGASSLIGMHHPRVGCVRAVADPESLPSWRALSTLRGYVGRRGSGLAPLEVITTPGLPEVLAEPAWAIVLVDARAGDAASLAEQIGRWLDDRPDAWVLVLGLGRVGDCPALASLLSLCLPGSGRQFRLLREAGEVLVASGLGLVARYDDPAVEDALERLRESYSGNHRYLDLLRQVNDAALRDARIDADTLRSNWTFGPLAVEIEELKRKEWVMWQRAEAAEEALRRLRRFTEPLEKLGRGVSASPVGGAWRLAKRVRRKLAPTPVGGAWRLAKRCIGRFLGRGRGDRKAQVQPEPIEQGGR